MQAYQGAYTYIKIYGRLYDILARAIYRDLERRRHQPRSQGPFSTSRKDPGNEVAQNGHCVTHCQSDCDQTGGD